MPTLEVNNFEIVCAVLGGFITLFGLVSYLLKEKFHLSEALLAAVFGLIFSHALGWIRPLEYANNNPENLELITLDFSRLVLGVQLVLAGVQLPSKYLWKERKSLSILLGPGMCLMWLITSLLVWALIPNIYFVQALAIGACVTPTDPVLSNSIVKGKFADQNIPPDLQKIIIAESGTNDGLGYPFLFLALYLIKYSGYGTESGNPGLAIGLWFGETWGYEIVLGVLYGAVVGWLAKELLHWAEERQYVDRESFLVFAITLALFIVGTCGMVGSDDVLACFIAGNVFTWDDWFRLETEDDSLQPTIDMLLNVTIFLYYGAVIPWYSFAHTDIVPLYRLAPLGLLVLLLRRLPMVLLFHKHIHQISLLKHAIFVGFFGPIGVSAVFYIYIAKRFLAEVTYEGVQREDAARLAELIEVIVWFLVTCSIVVHGLSIPLGKLGFKLPRTLSTALSSERVSRTVSTANDATDGHHIRRAVINESKFLERATHRREEGAQEKAPFRTQFLDHVARIFTHSLTKTKQAKVIATSAATGEHPVHLGGAPAPAVNKADISAPMNPRIIGVPATKAASTKYNESDESGSGQASPGTRRSLHGESVAAAHTQDHDFARERTIKFDDIDNSDAAGQ